MSVNFNALTNISDSWTNIKAIILQKELSMQYDDDSITYTIFAVDNSTIVYSTTIWKGTLPSSVIANGYSQSQNDTDKNDFETNYKPTANLKQDVSFVLVNPDQRFTYGYNTSSGSTLTVMRATAYTEQTSDAQRSLVSNSTDDDLSGTGARQIKITYYDQNMNGPYVEIVDMEGTTAVNTSNTDICYIDKMEVETVGSQLGNVGIITLKADVSGGGATIGTIAAGDGTTYWAHHYVSANKTMYLVSFMGTIKGTDTGALEIRRTIPNDSSKPEKSVTPKLRIPPGTSNTFSFAIPIMVAGPAQVTMYGRSDASSGTLDWSVAMDYYEE